MQFNTARCDPREIEHVVHEPRHRPSLPLYEAGGPIPLRLRDLSGSEEITGSTERRERIAKFVSEHRQKLVFALISQRKTFDAFPKVSVAHAAIVDLTLCRRHAGGITPCRAPRGTMSDTDIRSASASL